MIKVAGITKTYGQVRAVDGISFTAADGRVTGLLGPNGAGKSTTMRMMAGLEQPEGGMCTVGGGNPRDLTDPIRTIGVCLDGQGGIPGLRARDYLRTVAAPTGISRSRVDEVLEQAGLVSAAGRRIRTFSLGMKQRLVIATALLGDPDHFVLDEPINGLDPEGVIWVRDLLRELASEGRCVLLSSHLLSELEQCVDDLVIIQNGRLLAEGPLTEIMATQEHIVIVRSADDTRFIDELQRADAHVTCEGDQLIVRNLDPDSVGRVAHQAGIPLRLLWPQPGRLEERYLSLVGTPEG